MIFIPLSTIFRAEHTATDDNKFRLTDADVWISTGNLHVETNDCKYGDTTAQEATLVATAIMDFKDFNLSDLFIKNAGAGSNTTVNFVGVLMTEARKQELGVA